MYQFYFLSILCNFLLAFALSPDFLGRKAPSIGECVGRFMEKKAFPIGLSLVGIFVGGAKLFLVAPGDLNLVGDAFPALAGIFGGITLFLEKSGVGSEKKFPGAEILDAFLIRRKEIWSIAALLSAVLHFLFPSVLFL